MVGGPTSWWQDLGLDEPEQLAAELDPDPLTDRYLLQERWLQKPKVSGAPHRVTSATRIEFPVDAL